MWIDSHCHLNHDRNSPEDTPSAIISRARAAGVKGMVNICCRIATEFPTILSTAKAHDGVWCSVGTHPHDSGLPEEQAVTMEQIVTIANSDDKIIAIGESGLDFYYNRSPALAQEESFRKHIRACIETNLPLIVHARDADSDIIRIIRDENREHKLKGVMHCFSSGPLLAEKALEEGFYISFSGIITFKNSNDLRDIARTVPMNRILIETDAPFLAPEPKRGHTNEPAYVSHVGQFLANFYKLEEESFSTTCNNNFFSLFSKAKKTWTEQL
jgi:TatD DNase family protein